MPARSPAFARAIGARGAVVLLLVVLLMVAFAAVDGAGTAPGGTGSARPAPARDEPVGAEPGLTERVTRELQVVTAVAGDARRAGPTAPLLVAVLPFVVLLALVLRPLAVANAGPCRVAPNGSRGRGRRRAPPAVSVLV
jgi:hypothetical protein